MGIANAERPGQLDRLPRPATRCRRRVRPARCRLLSPERQHAVEAACELFDAIPRADGDGQADRAASGRRAELSADPLTQDLQRADLAGSLVDIVGTERRRPIQGLEDEVDRITVQAQ